MIDLKKYWHLNGEQVRVTCADGQVIIGRWIDWTSAQDNDPNPESMTILRSDGAPIEIYIPEIRDVRIATEGNKAAK